MNEPYFDLKEAIQGVYERTNIAPETIKEMLHHFFDITARKLAETGRVGYANFGHITLDARSGREVKLNGNTYSIPPRQIIHYNPDPEMCRKVNAYMPADGLPVSEGQD
jgi:nucleoid DNA-binding protein